MSSRPRPRPPPFGGRYPSQASVPLEPPSPPSPQGPPSPPAPPSPIDPLPPARSDSYPDFTLEEARDNPRKYSGYRVFSRWMASDQAFFILRRFGTLNTRVLLSMQDEIVELEDRLNFMDEEYSRRDYTEPVDNGTFRDDPFNDRRKLVQEVLPEKLARYNSFLNEYSQLMARPPVRDEDIGNVKRWLAPLIPESIKDLESNPLKYLAPIDELETAFMDHHDDLIAVQPKTRSWFRDVLERTFILRMPLLRRYFERVPEEYRAINTNTQTIWQNDGRIEKVSGTTIAFVGLGMLVGPLWVLEVFNQSDNRIRLGIITGFIMLFFVLVAVATTARVFDALAAAAAYSAVLMVFLQLNPGTVPASG